MRGLITDVRALRKRKVLIAETSPESLPLSFIAEYESSEPASIEIKVSARSTPLATALERMSRRNPALQQLIHDLNLDATQLSTPPGYTRLWELAGQALDEGEMYEREEVINLLQQKTGVTRERAERGFIMMTEAMAIEPTINPDLYYLGGSTPF